MTREQLVSELKKSRVYRKITETLGLTEELHISETHPELDAFKRLGRDFNIPVVANGHVPGKDLWLVLK